MREIYLKLSDLVSSIFSTRISRNGNIFQIHYTAPLPRREQGSPIDSTASEVIDLALAFSHALAHSLSLSLTVFLALARASALSFSVSLLLCRKCCLLLPLLIACSPRTNQHQKL